MCGLFPLFTVAICEANCDVGATQIDEVDSNVWTLPINVVTCFASYDVGAAPQLKAALMGGLFHLTVTIAKQFFYIFKKILKSP